MGSRLVGTRSHLVGRRSHLVGTLSHLVGTLSDLMGTSFHFVGSRSINVGINSHSRGDPFSLSIYLLTHFPNKRIPPTTIDINEKHMATFAHDLHIPRSIETASLIAVEKGLNAEVKALLSTQVLSYVLDDARCLYTAALPDDGNLEAANNIFLLLQTHYANQEAISVYVVIGALALGCVPGYSRLEAVPQVLREACVVKGALVLHSAISLRFFLPKMDKYETGWISRDDAWAAASLLAVLTRVVSGYKSALPHRVDLSELFHTHADHSWVGADATAYLAFVDVAFLPVLNHLIPCMTRAMKAFQVEDITHVVTVIKTAVKAISCVDSIFAGRAVLSEIYYLQNKSIVTATGAMSVLDRLVKYTGNMQVHAYVEPPMAAISPQEPGPSGDSLDLDGLTVSDDAVEPNPSENRLEDPVAPVSTKSITLASPEAEVALANHSLVLSNSAKRPGDQVEAPVPKASKVSVKVDAATDPMDEHELPPGNTMGVGSGQRFNPHVTPPYISPGSPNYSSFGDGDFPREGGKTEKEPAATYKAFTTTALCTITYGEKRTPIPGPELVSRKIINIQPHGILSSNGQNPMGNMCVEPMEAMRDHVKLVDFPTVGEGMIEEKDEPDVPDATEEEPPAVETSASDESLFSALLSAITVPTEAEYPPGFDF